MLREWNWQLKISLTQVRIPPLPLSVLRQVAKLLAASSMRDNASTFPKGLCGGLNEIPYVRSPLHAWPLADAPWFPYNGWRDFLTHVGTAGPGPRCSDSQHSPSCSLSPPCAHQASLSPRRGCTLCEAARTSLALRSWLIAVCSLSPNACHALWEQAALETA